ncbi:Hypothetical predicted protein, partial [Paramuricea clavata]
QDINAENASSSTTSNATNATTTSQVPRSGLPPFPPFNPHQDTATVGQRWTKCVRRFENLLISLREFDSTVRRGLLLTYVGESANDIFDILPDTGTTYQEAIDCFTQHFVPQGNTDMAIFDFRELKQG